ncbi:MAG: hypothetical protein IKI27_05910 [Methanobrevibacter sp.]|nr:hypothetical protein [Methanobrevibacter sp.]MBR7050974.1 hypothetical protein [Methanobrevibacter sp.]
MNSKRAIGILLLVCMIAVTVTAVSAQEVTIGDVKFNLPDGFEKIEEQSGTMPGDDLFGETTYDAFTNGTHSVVFNVATIKAEMNPQPMYDEEFKTINGYDGVYNKTFETFTYHTDDGHFVSITGLDPKILEEVIIEKGK